MTIVTSENVPALLAKILVNSEIVAPEPKHYFSTGICIRELTLPAGAVAVGAMHKTDHITMLLKGSMHIRIDNESKLVHAPYTFEALQGSRKIVFAYTECIVSNILPTTSRNIEEIEKMFTDLHDSTYYEELQCQQQ